MLDAATRRRIDTARDILVGKVPDPKSQVEQITIALIYKFMDDMDAEAEELGGERAFFAGEFAGYGWARLMRPGLGGHETLTLYTEALARMAENPGIPPLFRAIFTNAYLPFRDPETLRAFLKVIDEFRYDHSERLGDAFEYLLSVLGAQGAAGQFRTPRHLIDFMVEVLDPKKDERVLDPACGTAGFLISSYRHIRTANTDAHGHDRLSPDDRARLAANFTGYDISPDMVRLSLVNMYLHGFVAPRIFEYDTLTSQDRWHEWADVILANPPFMSPKGGIRPHNRFAVNSKRSEVLFVAYIAEHLTPGGRAGVIVPEGVIFQSQRAYTQLRKQLVEEYLLAVVSLPAGVFQPYSGVKTSILILDKALARQTDHIAFFSVAHDGYDLGAQRRPIAANDLPQARAELADYLGRLRAAAPLADFRPTLGRLVEKARLAADGDYNLSGERYRERSNRNSNYDMPPFEKVCTLEYGRSLPKKKRIDGPYPVMGSNGISGYHNEYLIEGPGIVIGRKGSAGEVTYVEKNFFPIDTTYWVKQVEPECTDILYIYHLLKSLDLPSLRGGAGIPGLNRNDVYAKHKLPLPPLEVQQEIVAEIEGYRRVMDGARAVIDNYRPHIPVDPAWPVVKTGRCCIVNPKKTELTGLDSTISVSFVPMSEIGERSMYFFAKDIKQLGAVSTHYTYFKNGDVLIAKVTPCFENGKAGIARGLHNGLGFGSSEFYVLRPLKEVLSQWIFLCLANPIFRSWAVPQMTGTGGLQRIPKAVIENYQIPLPPLATQQTIVAELEAEQALVAANRELVERMEGKIRAAVGRVWGEDSPPCRRRK